MKKNLRRKKTFRRVFILPQLKPSRILRPKRRETKSLSFFPTAISIGVFRQHGREGERGKFFFLRSPFICYLPASRYAPLHGTVCRKTGRIRKYVFSLPFHVIKGISSPTLFCRCVMEIESGPHGLGSRLIYFSISLFLAPAALLLEINLLLDPSPPFSL